MAQIAELAEALSYDVITARFAAASEAKSDASAEADLMKEVLKYKISHDTTGVNRTSVAHEASGETLNTAVRTIGPYRVQIKDTLSSGFNVNGLRERLQADIAQALAEGDTQVSRRDQLRAMLILLDEFKTYTKSERFDISTI